MQNKVALVTGAGGAIGQSIALQLAAEGVRVYANELEAKSLDSIVALAAETGLDLVPLPFDVADEQQVKSALGQLDNIDYLVNNAGVCPPLKDEELTERDWERIFSVNVKGTFFCIHHSIDKMKANRGCIVNISSGAAKTGGSFVSIPYAASKAAIHSITLSYAKKTGSVSHPGQCGSTRVHRYENFE
ncbi:SDR family NAD(P)-dependent oxidoreductase [Brevibacillus massiliensis]|uniref:SDR family NAD(P)-dependent oxidoreductase n=1 Tax=Brevibacillus massiliensis TaxID=1118054 RepID=UPI0002D81E04|nr:SDR family NAD(P)-dependent oxidoreductase [Brevibacillus massiliensis]